MCHNRFGSENMFWVSYDEVKNKVLALKVTRNYFFFDQAENKYLCSE